MATLLKTLTANGSKGHHIFTLDIYHIDSDVAGNTSYISWELRMSPNGRYGWNYSSGTPVTYTVAVNGQQWIGKIMSYDGITADFYIADEVRIPVVHNTDGNKSISFSFNISSQNYYYLPGTANASGSAALPKIPRASSISCSTADIESQATITINKQNSNFKHTITYKFGNVSGTIATETNDTTIKYKWPTSFYAQIPNSKSGTGTITCKTIYNGAVLGTSTVSFKATTNEALCKPTLSPQAYISADSITASLTGSTTKFIKSYTTATVSTGAAARNGARILNQRIINGSKSITSASGTIPKITSKEFTFRAFDSRGYITEQTITRELVDYVRPTCSLEVGVPTATGEMSFTISGKCFNASFGAVNNVVELEYTVLENGVEYIPWTPTTLTSSGNTYTATVNLTGLNYQKTYTIQARIKDKLVNYTYSDERKVKTTPIFDWSENDFNFNVPIKMSGVEMDYIVEQGVKSGWYYKKWNSGAAEAWYSATVSGVDVGEFNMNGFYYCGSKQVNFPFTFKTVDYVSATGGSTANLNFVRPFTSSTTYISYIVVGMADIPSATVKINLEVKGKWK